MSISISQSTPASTLNLNISKIRLAIPALSQTYQNNPVVYLNGPGGTQVPSCVSEAMANYLLHSNSNIGAPFPASEKTVELMDQARSAMRLFLNAKSNKEISFGLNMTSLTFQFSRVLAQTWKKGDQIILTDLDHDSNISPWVLAAQERGVEVKYWPLDLKTMNLNLKDLEKLLNKNTRLVCFTMASNLLGSVPDLDLIIKTIHQAGALVFLDATHACAHFSINVQQLNCDFLVCSAYKFSGPHLGVLYSKLELLDYLIPKIYHSPYHSQWELGTQNFEALSGLLAILKYKSSMLGPESLSLNKENLENSMTAIFNYEKILIQQFLQGLKNISNISLYGLSLDQLNQLNQLSEDYLDNKKPLRTPTFALRINNKTPQETAEYFAQKGFFTAGGFFHCSRLIKTLGLENQGGIWRVGLAYYNTAQEVDALLNAISDLVKPSSNSSSSSSSKLNLLETSQSL